MKVLHARPLFLVVLSGLLLQMVYVKDAPIWIAFLVAAAGAISTREVWREFGPASVAQIPSLKAPVDVVTALWLVAKAPFWSDSTRRLVSPLAAHESDASLSASAIIAGGYLAFVGLSHVLPAMWRRGSLSNRRAGWLATRDSPRALSLVRLVASSLIGARAVLQFAFGLTEVGARPNLPATGVLHFVVTSGALAVLAVLVSLEMSIGLPAWRRASIPLSALLTFLGIVAGWRSTPVVILLVWLLVGAAVWTQDRARKLLFVALGVLVALAAFGILSVAFRPDAVNTEFIGLSAGPARLGGQDFLVDVIESGSRIPVWSLLISYTEVVNQELYGLPAGANTGFAITLWGFGFLSGGWNGVWITAAALALSISVADRALLSIPAEDHIRASLSTILWIWVASLMLEGTVWIMLKSLIASLTVWVVLVAVLRHKQGARGVRRTSELSRTRHGS